MFAEHKDDLNTLALETLGIKLSPLQLEQFCTYGDLLVEWNQKMNLTRITDVGDVFLKHFVDSMALNKYLQGNKVVDIGTGAGFPGLPLKIINPDLEFVLVDSLKKRLDFLNHVIDSIGLTTIELVHARAEDFGHNPKYRQSFDMAISRAVARLPVLLELVTPALRRDGFFVASKGAKVEEELTEAKRALSILGCEVISVEDYNLGENAENHAVIIIKKVKNTPKEYPRKAGLPAKKPLS